MAAHPGCLQEITSSEEDVAESSMFLLISTIHSSEFAETDNEGQLLVICCALLLNPYTAPAISKKKKSRKAQAKKTERFI